MQQFYYLYCSSEGPRVTAGTPSVIWYVLTTCNSFITSAVTSEGPRVTAGTPSVIWIHRHLWRNTQRREQQPRRVTDTSDVYTVPHLPLHS
ncbi:hypothetical protein AVEN_36170-1 [Araneus ventricosus]|uniref:Uncharacterized protein n=1 Tax=Araneus ventricosus TaxID=182803 RepID=A0A4Y2WG68_ARAVE|nr:hypothetical protein AVEN_36170-1 [Araneus ventricosus]